MLQRMIPHLLQADLHQAKISVALRVLLLNYLPHIRTMSRASKLTLAATGLGTAGIVYFVHWSQEQEKAVRQVDCS